MEGSFTPGILDKKGTLAFTSQVIFVQPLLDKLWWDETFRRARELVECSADLNSDAEGDRRSLAKKTEKLDILITFLNEGYTQQLVTQLTQLYASLVHRPGLDTSLLDLPYEVEFRAIEPLFWALTTIGYDEGSDTTLPLSVSLDFLQAHLAADEQAGKRVSSRLLRRVSDIATSMTLSRR